MDRALQLLSLLVRSESLGVTAAAQVLGVAPSTAHRLLTTLCGRGFAVQDADRTYRIGPELLAATSGAAARLARLRRLVRQCLTDLHEHFGETVHLMILTGTEVRFIDGIEAEHPLRVGMRIGARMPAFVTSGGKAMLAQLGSNAVARLYPEGLPDWSDSVPGDPSALQRELTQVRESGVAINRDESEQGVTAFGACITERGQEPMAAIVVALPSTRVRPGDEPRILDALTEVSATARVALDGF